MGPFKGHQDLAAELLKTAKTRNIEAGLPITTRWIPRAALVAGDALAWANGGGTNFIEKRMLGPAEMILVGAPPPPTAPEEVTSADLISEPLSLARWTEGQSSGTRELCGPCGAKEGSSNRVFREVGVENFQGDPVQWLLGFGGLGRLPRKGL